MQNPLLDTDFLKKLDSDRNRTIYARIISLNQQEHPIEQLEGVVTAGSISVDGQSAVRRTCSLTLSAKNLNINNVYWGVSTKVKIEIGLENNILDYKYYGKIIWFPQGLFILTDFKTTQTLNNYTINLTGKDKMCLLNGDVSGNIPAPTVFDSYADRTGQSYTISESDGIGEDDEEKYYVYNNFLDEEAIENISQGFNDRYGSDYQYIRNVKKIIALQYKPNIALSDNDELNMTIQFSSVGEVYNLKDLLSDAPNSKGYYDINLDDKYVYGFIVNNCRLGDSFNWEIEQKIPISIIIQELLHQFGQERYSNIVIKNIEPYALEMLDNDQDETLYVLNDGINYTTAIHKEALVKNYRIYPVANTVSSNLIELNASGEVSNLIFEKYVGEDNTSLVDIDTNSTLMYELEKPTTIIKNGDPSTLYTVRPILKGEAAGYGMTLLVYPDELKANAGDSITSILDKIVNMLGNYEYFYNLKGQFVFQMKPAYLRLAWNGTIYLDKDNYVTPGELLNSVVYIFDDATLTTQYQNNPNINNIKNDFIIWGERKNKDQTIKFHGRYAIENPPVEYTDFNGYTWTTNKNPYKNNNKLESIKNINGQTRRYALNENVDWRQLISIMADDWYEYHTKDDYEINLRQNNCWINEDITIDLFPSGRTGYEQFYLDLTSNGGFWNTLYNSNYIKYQYVMAHKELQVGLINDDGTYNQAHKYYSLFAAFNPTVCASQQFNERQIGNKVKILSSTCILNPDLNIYKLDIKLDDDESKNNLNEELLILNRYIKNKYWTNKIDEKELQLYSPDIEEDEVVEFVLAPSYEHQQQKNELIELKKSQEEYLNTNYQELQKLGSDLNIIVNFEEILIDEKIIYRYIINKDNIETAISALYNTNTSQYNSHEITEKEYYNKNHLLDNFSQFLLSYSEVEESHKYTLNQLKDLENASTDEYTASYIFNIENLVNIKKISCSIYGKVVENNEIQYKLIKENVDSSYNVSTDQKQITAFISQASLPEEYIKIYCVFSALVTIGINKPNLSCEVNPSIFSDKIIQDNLSIIIQIISTSEYALEGTINIPTEKYNNLQQLAADLSINDILSQYYKNGQYKYWHRNVIENPELLIFWFDFFKADEFGIGKFATTVIGDRPKTINDTAIKTIIYRDTPDIIYCDLNEYLIYKKTLVLKDGYKYAILNTNGEGYAFDDIEMLLSYKESIDNAIINGQEDEKEKYITIIKELGFTEESFYSFCDSFKDNNIKQNIFIRSVRGKSVHEQAEEMLYQYSYYNDTVNITTVPIYYLQPNTMISIKDDLSKIVGQYIISKINISLAYNGMMQITTIKSPERIY